MTLDGARFERLMPGRLVGGTATVRPLDRSPRVRGISQADGFLLFARPNTLGCVAENVIWVMVVDTVGTAGPPPFAGAELGPRFVDAHLGVEHRRRRASSCGSGSSKTPTSPASAPSTTFPWSASTGS